MYHFPCTQEATTGVYKTIGGNAPQIKTITAFFKFALHLTEGLLNQQRGSLIDVNEDGVHHVTNGSYAYIAVRIRFFSIRLFSPF